MDPVTHPPSSTMGNVSLSRGKSAVSGFDYVHSCSSGVAERIELSSAPSMGLWYVL
jgi:hypothetical protein